MTLDEARALMADPRANRRVVYLPPGRPEASADEVGTIVSVGNLFVFVVYGKDWQAKATNPAHLTVVPA